MAITRQDYQPTALTPAPSAAVAPEKKAGPDPDRVGVVFVHGIGTQQPAETFLEWSAPIVRLLTTWRIDHGFSPDPVVRSEFSFSASSQPYLELDIPAVDDHPARRWVITEAWWAAQVRAPGLSTMTGYVRHGLPGILRGIRDGGEAGRRLIAHLRRERISYELASSAMASDAWGPALVQRELVAAERWRWIDYLDVIQGRLIRLAFLPALLLGTLALLAYAPFRALPIKALRDAAVLQSADSFLTTWFGDLPDLLDDPVQSANVRARVAESIDRLRANQRCGSIVLIAHSGGAIVCFTTLLDAAYNDDHHRVDKLMTLGQGLALGWRLDRTGQAGGGPRTDRLTGDLATARPTLRWTDVWSSYDPAPGGPIMAPNGVTLPAIDSRPVTNRMSVLGDHGGYWENDEGFVIPLLRHLDVSDGSPDDSRYFRDAAGRMLRIERRRQRVAILAAWRWVAALAALIPTVATTIGWAVTRGAVGGPALIGQRFAAWWGTLPGHELISGPLDLLSGTADYPAWFVDIGEWVLGGVVVAVAFLVLYRFGAGVWARWDERERAIARHEELGPIDRRDVWVVAVLFLAFAAAIATVWVKLSLA